MNNNIKTPAFLFDIDKLRKRVNDLNELAKKTKINLCYAIKANPFLISYLKDYIHSFEVCSPGEFRICEKLNIKPEQIVLSGVNKEYNDIERIVNLNGTKTLYTIESEEHLKFLNDLANKNGIKLPVIIRLTSGNQFGVDITILENIIEKRNDYSLEIKGIQFYSGTQKKKIEVINHELNELKSLINLLRDKYNYETKVLEYGPGLAVNYFYNDGQPVSYQNYEELIDAIEKVGFKCEITLELGRYIAYECGEYITKVVDIKKNSGINYAIVDGGINHLNYYGQTMAMKIPNFEHIKTNKINKEDSYTICGSLCTVSDVLVRNLTLNTLNIGDTLIFKNTGAYSITEGIYLFLSRDMPRIYVKENKNVTLVRDFIETNQFNTI
ncbi:diaminopimelate decarboxylase family protein [Haploplasma axanthum]|uniref:Diaminopimelate decarboxylase n=1 Tax=Haploplasma axanthum TaxID=29552 RepID=A0A449BE49_HAPAX|nr:alanine racemase [Haploplasma axanthum]VEU80734.1 Diaminopimelate decarboxylase [Haploplasma axanthum]